MKGQAHVFDAREDGRFRTSLTYQDPGHSPRGKTSDDMDTFQGRFIELVPYKKIVEVVEFKSRDPGFADETEITTIFADVEEGTKITILCHDIPVGIRPEDDEVGSRESS